MQQHLPTEQIARHMLACASLDIRRCVVMVHLARKQLSGLLVERRRVTRCICICGVEYSATRDMLASTIWSCTPVQHVVLAEYICGLPRLRPRRDWHKLSTRLQLASLWAHARKTKAEYLAAMRSSSRSARQACVPSQHTCTVSAMALH